MCALLPLIRFKKILSSEIFLTPSSSSHEEEEEEEEWAKC